MYSKVKLVKNSVILIIMKINLSVNNAIEFVRHALDLLDMNVLLVLKDIK